MFSRLLTGFTQAGICWSIKEVMYFFVRTKRAQAKPKLKEIFETNGIMNSKDALEVRAVERTKMRFEGNQSWHIRQGKRFS